MNLYLTIAVCAVLVMLWAAIGVSTVMIVRADNRVESDSR